jgi:hypothetical protein
MPPMRYGRKLRSYANMSPIKSFWGPVNGCEANTAQNTCDSNADCTWCKSAAVKSACYSLADAATLPASIFACDAKTEEEVAPV